MPLNHCPVMADLARYQAQLDREYGIDIAREQHVDDCWKFRDLTTELELELLESVTLDERKTFTETLGTQDIKKIGLAVHNLLERRFKREAEAKIR